MLGYFRKDDDGHNYFVPVDKVVEFDKTMRKIEESDQHSDEWYELIGFFESRFDEYRCQPPSTYLAEIVINQLKN